MREPEETIIYPVVSAGPYHQVDTLFDACDICIMSAHQRLFTSMAAESQKIQRDRSLRLTQAIDVLKTPNNARTDIVVDCRQDKTSGQRPRKPRKKAATGSSPTQWAELHRLRLRRKYYHPLRKTDPSATTALTRCFAQWSSYRRNPESSQKRDENGRIDGILGRIEDLDSIASVSSSRTRP